MRRITVDEFKEAHEVMISEKVKNPLTLAVNGWCHSRNLTIDSTVYGSSVNNVRNTRKSNNIMFSIFK